MVSPTARRRVVTYLCKERLYSERRACVLVQQPRATNRYIRRKDPREQHMVKRLHCLAQRFPRYGYRRLTDKLHEEGWKVNRKRVRRLCRQEGLKVFKKQRRRISRGNRPLLTVTHRGHAWSYDFLFDQTTDGRTIKILTVLDLYTRECHAIEIDRRITTAGVIAILRKLFALYGAPEFIRSDNGPEFVAKRIQQWLRAAGVKTQYIERGAPWQNAHIESFHDKLRDERLNSELFFSLAEARFVVEDWRIEYNTIRPHSSLGRIPPAAYAVKIRTDDDNRGLPTVGRCARAGQDPAPRPTMDNPNLTL